MEITDLSERRNKCHRPRDTLILATDRNESLNWMFHFDRKAGRFALETVHAFLVLCLTNAAALCCTSQGNYVTLCGGHGSHITSIRSQIRQQLTSGITGFFGFYPSSAILKGARGRVVN
jgi:hypothetical protein